MTFTRISARLAAVATTVLCSATLLIVGIAPPAAAAPCPDVAVVFARGTDEPGGIGRVGQAFTDALQAQIPGRTVSAYGVNYPASYDFLAAQDGAIDATAYIRKIATQCPSTRFVLGGYSQGAAVMDMLIGIPPLGNKLAALGEKLGDVGTAAPLASDLADQVAAVAVFGNPAAKFSNPATSAAPPFGARAVDLCMDGDPICSRGRNPFAHNDYEKSPFIAQAAQFAAGLV
ncbi:MAG: cutinase family protein [Candidatus Sericytochromatia bacterium]